MLASKPTSPQKVLTLSTILLLAVGAIGWMVYANFFLVGQDPQVTEWAAEISQTARQRYPPVPSINPSHPVFSSPQFTSLRPFAQLPVVAGRTGRDNPFAVIPYLGQATSTGEAIRSSP